MNDAKPRHFDEWGIVHRTVDRERTLYRAGCGAESNAPDDTVETDNAPPTCLFCVAHEP